MAHKGFISPSVGINLVFGQIGPICMYTIIFIRVQMVCLFFYKLNCFNNFDCQTICIISSICHGFDVILELLLFSCARRLLRPLLCLDLSLSRVHVLSVDNILNAELEFAQN